MTKDEIKALIASKLAGQGTNIDAASVLPSILEGIIDLIPTLPAPYELPVATDEVLGGVKVGKNLSITEEGMLSAPESKMITMDFSQFADKTKAEAAELCHITEEELDRLFDCGYCAARKYGFAETYLVTVLQDGDLVLFFSGDPVDGTISESYYFTISHGLYTMNEV